MSNLGNFTYDEITVGQIASYSKTVDEDGVKMFAALSGDVNPVHLDADFAAGTMFKQRIAHGMFTGGLISAAIAMELPGPGTVYLSQDLSFRAPVFLGDTITVSLEVIDKLEGKKFVTLSTVAKNQHGKIVVKGIAKVLPPAEKLSIPRPELPQVTVA
jgi:3-hydroxybutyryl-CoA dehydratase